MRAITNGFNMKSVVKFFAGIAIVAIGLVVGLFVFFTINEAVAINEAPATAASTPTPSPRQTLSNGSTIQYYEGRRTTAAEAFATMDARATATAIARGQP